MTAARVFAAVAGLVLVASVETLVAATETRYALVRVHTADGAPLGSLLENDVSVQEGSVVCVVTRVTPAAYPVAVVVDTSGFARDTFATLRDAAQHLARRLDGREVAVYASGNPVVRLSAFSRDAAVTSRALDRAVANPQGAARPFEAVVRAATDLAERVSDLTRLIVFSAGGYDSSGVPPRDVVTAINRSRSIVDVIDLRQDIDGAIGRRSRTVAVARPIDEVVFKEVAGRTHGEYVRILSGSAFTTAVQTVERDVAGEYIVEYDADAAAPHQLRVGIAVPDVTVTGVALRK